MKTKSFLFTLITGIIFNTYVFGQTPGNETFIGIKTDILSMQNEGTLQALDDTSKVTLDSTAVQQNEQEESQMSEQEKKETRIVAAVVTLIGGGVVAGSLVGRWMLRELNKGLTRGVNNFLNGSYN
jgi:hypothetical protein